MKPITLDDITKFVSEYAGELDVVAQLLLVTYGQSAVEELGHKLELSMGYCAHCECDTHDDTEGDCLVCGCAR